MTTSAYPTARRGHPGSRSTASTCSSFIAEHDRYLCELRVDGEIFGLEAQFWGTRNLSTVDGRRAGRRTRTPRELAIAWAEEESNCIEKAGA